MKPRVLIGVILERIEFGASTPLRLFKPGWDLESNLSVVIRGMSAWVPSIRM